LFGDDYILKISTATQNEISLGLYAYFYSRLIKTDPEPYTGKLAAAIAMELIGEPAKESHHEAFRVENSRRIREEIGSLIPENRLCEILSGAAYNIGYGRYVAKGGSRLFNTFLTFTRLEGRVLSRSDNDVMLKCRLELLKKDEAILRPIISLQKFSLWRCRNNPNEQEYYRIVNAFALENKVSEGA